ncbi:MAG: dockerin type I repeat-containing protein [Clostridia bacterium]|nr:dockerin type I repeat-containing protein [Clostridia bacterium]
MGWYPQSLVTDETLIAKLNKAGGEWVSYGYYSGTGKADGNMKPGDFMKYKDVLFNGSKYRAVTFTEYRPAVIYKERNEDSSHQSENGYSVNQVYWFRFDPIVWDVLDPAKGLVVCHAVLDGQPYNNTIFEKEGVYYQNASCTNYANNYRESSIRKWLKEEFYRTAFSSAQQALLQETRLDYLSQPPCTKYDSGNCVDKVFFLSRKEVLNKDYGFDWAHLQADDARTAKASEYAKCQGLYVYKNPNPVVVMNGNASYITVTAGEPSDSSNEFFSVDFYGYVLASGMSEVVTGVRPACLLDPNAQIVQCKVEEVGTAKSAPAGDVDGDGKVSSADARLALRASVGLEKYAKGSAQFTAADADKDGKITSADARLILRASVGLEKLS